MDLLEIQQPRMDDDENYEVLITMNAVVNDERVCEMDLDFY